MFPSCSSVQSEAGSYIGFKMITERRRTISQLNINSPTPILIDSEDHRPSPSITQLPAFSAQKKSSKNLLAQLMVKGLVPLNIQSPKQELKLIASRSQINSTVEKSGMTRNVIDRKKSQTPICSFGKQQEQSIFQVPEDKRATRRPKTAFQRTRSASTLYRPASSHQHQRSSSLSKPAMTQVERSISSKSLYRPTTGVSRSESRQNNRYFEFESRLKDAPTILKLADEPAHLRQRNYINENKRAVSAKKREIYITGVNTQETKPSKPREEEMVIVERQVVSRRQRQQIKQKHRLYLQFMKENMPLQYLQCLEYLNKMALKEQSEQLLFGVSLECDRSLELSAKQIEELQVKNFYHSLLNKCVQIQHAINKTKPIDRKKPLKYGSLNVEEQQQVLQLYRVKKQKEERQESGEQQNHKIKEVTSCLSFFRELKAEVFHNIFNLSYEIRPVEEGSIVIKEGDPLQSVFVILYGSVSKKAQRKHEESIRKDKTPLADLVSTLFDGEVFGIPNTAHQVTLNYEITAIERTLLMAFPYSQYRRALSSSEKITDRIELLKQALPRRQSLPKLTIQDYESIAYQLQTITLNAQEVVFREGETVNSLILVSGGQLDICFEEVVVRRKERKGLRKAAVQQQKQVLVSECRRTNLVDFEVLEQSQHSQQHYLHKVKDKKVRYDVLNWCGFAAGLEQAEQQLTYSLMAAMDDTRIEILSPSKLEGLSDLVKQHIKHHASVKAPMDRIRRETKEQVKWEKYKQGVCLEVARSKGKY